MSQTKTFLLPDLGEGLPDATIVEWFVKVGDTIRLDDNLVSMETAKAVVEVPSPVSGKVLKLAGGPGDVIVTGKMLAEFEVDPSMPQRAEGQDTGHHHGAGSHVPATATRSSPPTTAARSAPPARPSRRPSKREDSRHRGRRDAELRCRAQRSRRWRSAASRRCRRCAHWRASSASTSPACAPPAPMAW